MTQTKISRCDHCNGTKKIMALGGVKVDCTTCNGVGHVTVAVADNTIATVKDDKDDKAKK